ncbi:hypothetical protein FC83_GL001255 [Agrilactobacillus composti DSM 18527 = JCM 14202]|uniref:Glutamine amidotransferase domain-containing protein n=1 Tax=Agrilactobacillus composti DSM 18527 = JCM 14202 TaxID=1423734 RepID=X0PF38_9LACO|nr:type 1 glutamine amidotransferase [Agrilactobacillus composti]KRM35128.1 hypothetical protein FC83_GL001255 [Agrilactobacillus composti DSM 18527 = JCM 14202]GAF40248.1 glutamine amidotransferase class-I [Agrilactobacillus composti DSM 18527 = JCM 14202]
MIIDAVLHVPHETLGQFATVIDSFGDTIRYHKIWEDQTQLKTLNADEIDFLIVMGGPNSVNDDTPWLADERQLIKAVQAKGGRVLGICLGAQQIAKAFGGKVAPMRHKELGWFPVEATVDDLPSGTVFHWHGEKIELPDLSDQIYTNSHCPAQGFRLGAKVYGLQFHPEMTTTTLTQLLAADKAYLEAPGEMVQSLASIEKFDISNSNGARITKMVYESLRRS